MQAAWVLHRRPYRETSALVELLTAEGRQRCVIRGRGKDALLSPFVPLMVELGPVRDLRSLNRIEPMGPAVALEGSALFCGLYLNEICVRLLPEQDENLELMTAYSQALVDLARSEIEATLRSFELSLLGALGFDWSVAHLADGSEVQASQRYWVHPESGPRLAPESAADAYTGETLKALQAQQFERPEVLSAAKRLNRARLNALLGCKPLRSRELMKGMSS